MLNYQPVSNSYFQPPLISSKFDMGRMREAAAHWILMHEHPFTILEEDELNIMLKLGMPEWKKLKNVLNKVDNVSLTTDMWKSKNQKIEYMVVTWHWINSEWKLQKRVLSFYTFPASTQGVCLFSVCLFKCSQPFLKLFKNLISAKIFLFKFLICRAGRIRNSYNFYKKIFPDPVTNVLGMILDSCRRNGEIELGTIVSKEISEIKSVDAGNYVQLAHCFASTDKWDGVGESWVQMRSLGLRKLRVEFYEMQGTITPFLHHHSSHPQFANTISLLGKLTTDITEIVYYKVGTNNNHMPKHNPNRE
ncbi:pentatricopeptide repeat-containing protein [Dorcoceras hygrometricum]|uniref:Pentatricopeptide repeat-containing protein n=1 Tax=Dorcoceras hygrometricum TaxID=472368 RepID=A0A2Z7AVL4_9LAMI|nr:pentatricopeptide repeat-containing protein [Dorcoceras hygrometricum]